MLLAGKVALITGTGGGQGRAAALRFAAEGAKVVGCDVKVEGANETQQMVEANGGTMTTFAPTDLGDPEEARRWVQDGFDAYGRVDILYNNASSVRFGPIPDFSVDDWRYTVRNELDLVFYVTKYAWPHLAKQGGVIINTASIAGHLGSGVAPEIGHAATKGGVLAMTRQMALEGAPVGIRANSISPGPIATPGTAELFEHPEALEHMLSELLIKRIGEPEDIAALALFLASEQASFITGADFKVDGGMSAG